MTALPMTLLALGLGLGLGLACSDKDDTGGGSDGSTDGGGGDGGSDGGDGGGGGIDCDDPPAPSSVGGPDCVTDSISCGDQIIDTTEGGTSNWDGAAYQGWYCLISTASQYNGPERVYAFDHPGDGTATFTLTAPCEDLDLIALHWTDEDTCPLAKYSIGECEGDDGGGTNTISIWNNEPSRYLVIVDAPGDHEAPFRLSASCE